MKKIYLAILIVPIFYAILFAYLGVANAQLKDVNFPIKELGNCANEQECKAYCDIDANMRQCLDFAQKQGLFAQKKAKKDKKIQEIMETMKGPGKCSSKIECKTYCDNPDNMEECIVFGKKHGLIPPDEIKEVEKALKAIKKGHKPPPCQGKQECDIYCSQPEHIEECIAFGEAAGFISPEEAKMIRKTGGKGPGGCQGKQECDTFCQNPDNIQECMEFGLKHGLMNPQEEKETRMMLKAIKKGLKPLPCHSKEECDIYCSQLEHMEECIAFGEAAGFISPEEAIKAKRMKKMDIGSGPGGCQGEQECKEFCDNPDNMEECLKFAVDAGFMSKEEAERIKKMDKMDMGPGPGGCQTREECDIYCQNPNNMRECMEFGKKMGIVEHQEFEKIERMSQEMRQNGPGGCQTPQECKTYCDNPENMEECVKFSEKMGLIRPVEAEVIRILRPGGPGGPGGCQSKEECKEYCMSPKHIEECLDFFLEQKIIIPEDADKMRRIRQMAPQPMEQGAPMILPDDMMRKGRDDLTPDIRLDKMRAQEDQMPMMPMMPPDIENMPIEKLMELMPPEIKEKFKDFPPEKIKEALKTFKLETMLLEGRDMRDMRDVRDAPTREQGIPGEFPTQIQTMPLKPIPCQTREECEIYCSQPEHKEECEILFKQSGQIMPFGQSMEIRTFDEEFLPQDIPQDIREKIESGQMPIEEIKQLLENKIQIMPRGSDDMMYQHMIKPPDGTILEFEENRMPMILPDDMMPREEIMYQNFIREQSMEQMEQIKSMEVMDQIQQIQQMEYIQPEPELELEIQTFFDNTKNFLANIINITNN